MLLCELKRKRTDDCEVEELAAQLVAKLEELIGTTTSREFTCLGVLYVLPEAQELTDMTAANLRSQIALVEHDLTAVRIRIICTPNATNFSSAGLLVLL